MAHDAAESVAPTNYYTKVIVSKRGREEGERVGATREELRKRKGIGRAWFSG
jgi:hypothetical protein